MAKLLATLFQPAGSTRPRQIKSYAQPSSYRYDLSEIESDYPSSDGPEERVRQYAINLLIEDYGYHKDDIETEFPVTMGSQRKRADIVVFYPDHPHQTENIFIVVECKREDIGSDNEAHEQLKSYMSAIPNANYGVVASYQWKVIQRVNDSGRHSFRFISELPDADGKLVPVQYKPRSYVAETSSNRTGRSPVADVPRSLTGSTLHSGFGRQLLVFLAIIVFVYLLSTLTGNNDDPDYPVVTLTGVVPLPTASETMTPHRSQPSAIPIGLPTRVSATATPDVAQNSLEPTRRQGSFVMNTSNSAVDETETAEQRDASGFGSERPTQTISLSSTILTASRTETSWVGTLIPTVGAENQNSPQLPEVVSTMHYQYLGTHLPEIYEIELTRTPHATESSGRSVPPVSSIGHEVVDPTAGAERVSNGLVRGSQKVPIRSMPNSHASIIAYASSGQVLQIIGQDSDGLWFQVSLANVVSGWIASDQVAVRDT